MDHIITADDNEEIEIHSKWLDWTWMLGQLFKQPENEVVTSAIEKLCTKISGKFDAEILLHELETMAKEAKENSANHWTFTTP
jgi:diacylglycerol kinase